MINLDYYLNPFLANVPILYPLKTPENLWFSGVFRGYKIGTLAGNGLIYKGIKKEIENIKYKELLLFSFHHIERPSTENYYKSMHKMFFSFVVSFGLFFAI